MSKVIKKGLVLTLGVSALTGFIQSAVYAENGNSSQRPGRSNNQNYQGNQNQDRRQRPVHNWQGNNDQQKPGKGRHHQWQGNNNQQDPGFRPPQHFQGSNNNQDGPGQGEPNWQNRPKRPDNNNGQNNPDNNGQQNQEPNNTPGAFTDKEPTDNEN